MKQSSFLTGFTIVFFILYIGFTCRAQVWQPLGTGMNWEVRDLFADTVDNVLYAGGGFKIAGDIQVDGIGKWDGIKWDSLGSGVDTNDGWPTVSNVLAITKYDGNLYTGGAFLAIGGISAKGIAKWDGSNWNIVGSSGKAGNSGFSVWRLLVDGNELYAMGSFDSIGGIPASKIAKWNDTTWSSFPVLESDVGGWGIADAKFYKGQLYVGGNFYSWFNDIAIWDGVSWKPWGGGLSGLMTHVETLTIYKDDLYIGGYFFEADGNPGNCIAKWDGSNWSNVGGGMDAQVLDLVVYNGELWAGGKFSMAGGVPVSYIAKWDGTQWYNIGANFDNAVTSLASLNGDLYAAGGFWTIDGDSVNRIAKYTTDTGTNVVSITYNQIDIEIYPNPATGHITLTNLPQNEDVRITVYNVLSKLVYEKETAEHQIDLSGLPSGVYMFHVTQGKTTFRKKVIKL